MKIISIVEFGSSARSENDSFSDKDFFVWVDTWEDRTKIINEVKRNFKHLFDDSKSEFIIHDTKSFNFMLKKGSLFLWHLKLEAIPLFGKEAFQNKINELVEFTRYEYKFTNYLSVFEDLKEARVNLPQTTSFDYSILFSVIRNLSILVCYKMGTPKFGRTSAFETLIARHKRLSITFDDYLYLLNKKLEYERGFSIAAGNDIDIGYFISKVEKFGAQIKEILVVDEQV